MLSAKTSLLSLDSLRCCASICSDQGESCSTFSGLVRQTIQPTGLCVLLRPRLCVAWLFFANVVRLFRRTSSQKPGDELLANFRQQFPQVVGTTSASTAAPAIAQAGAGENPLLNPPNQERFVILKSQSIIFSHLVCRPFVWSLWLCNRIVWPGQRGVPTQRTCLRYLFLSAHARSCHAFMLQLLTCRLSQSAIHR